MSETADRRRPESVGDHELPSAKVASPSDQFAAVLGALSDHKAQAKHMADQGGRKSGAAIVGQAVLDALEAALPGPGAATCKAFLEALRPARDEARDLVRSGNNRQQDVSEALLEAFADTSAIDWGRPSPTKPGVVTLIGPATATRDPANPVTVSLRLHRAGDTAAKVTGTLQLKGLAAGELADGPPGRPFALAAGASDLDLPFVLAPGRDAADRQVTAQLTGLAGATPGKPVSVAVTLKASSDAPSLPTVSLSGPGDVAPSPDVATGIAARVGLSAPAAADVTGRYAVTGPVPGDLPTPAEGTFTVPAGEPAVAVPMSVPPLRLDADETLTVSLADIVLAATPPVPLPAPPAAPFVLRKREVDPSGDGKTWSVSNAREGQKVAREAKPGDEVVLADGDYDDDFFAAPEVLFRAEHLGKASINVPAVVNGAGAVVQGLVFPLSLRLNGAGSGLRACQLRGDDGKAGVTLHLFGPGSFAEYVEVTRFPHRGVQVTGAGSRLSRFWIHDQAFKGNSITGGTGPLMVGGYHAFQKEAQVRVDCVIEYGRIEGTAYHNCGEIKGIGSTWRFVCATNGDLPADIYVRWGSEHTFVRCFLDGGRLALGDNKNVAIGCVTQGAHGASLCFRRGGVTAEQMRQGTEGYPFAVNCRGVAHQGLVDPAWANGTGAAWAKLPVGTVLEGIDKGQVKGSGPYSMAPLSTPVPPEPARMLAPSELGPQAWRPAA